MRVLKNQMINHLHAIPNAFCWNKNSKTDEFKLDQVRKRLIRKKIPVDRCKYLGEGAYGQVFQINENTALKISTDRSEINTMAIVKRHPNKNIVKVKDVFRCKIGGHTHYFIVEELLRHADKAWSDFADLAMYGVMDVCITQKSVKRTMESPTTAREISHLRKKLPQMWKWLHEVAVYFDQHKIKFADIHCNNIMRRRKQHVLIDLGVATAPRQKVDTL